MNLINNIYSQTFKIYRNEIDPDNLEHEGYIKGLFVSFVDEIFSKAHSLVTNEQFGSKVKLIDTAKLYKVSVFLVPMIILIYSIYEKKNSSYLSFNY